MRGGGDEPWVWCGKKKRSNNGGDILAAFHEFLRGGLVKDSNDFKNGSQETVINCMQQRRRLMLNDNENALALQTSADA